LAKAGPFAVETASFEWTDAARNREVPVKVYYPKDGAGPFPLIVFSHGLGGSREGYEYLGRHWASHGYVSVHVQHKGSDTEVWKGAANREEAMKGMRDSLADVTNAIDRPRDVSFVIDSVTKLNAEDARFKGRIDLDRVGMAGHSFGAWTTLAVAGQGSPALARLGKPLADPRVKAAIAMSAPAPAAARRGNAFAGVKIPALHMTGTLDDSPISDSKAADRRVPFDKIAGVDQFLVTFEGGDHMVFSGRPRAMGGGAKDPLFQDLILQSTTAFWDAYLRGDAAAKTWLAGDGFEKVLGANGKWEKKLVGK
jgi:predicted dienelactone hydrolase